MRNTYGQHTLNWTSFSRLPYEIHHPRILLLTGKPACIALKQMGAQIPTTHLIRTSLDTSVTGFRMTLYMSLILKNVTTHRLRQPPNLWIIPGPERQLAMSMDLSKNSVICARIHGHHLPVRTVSNL